jgi:hypothetical protein
MTETQAAEPQAPRPAHEIAAKEAADRKLAAIKAHPSYEPLKAANPHREPSVLELAEHAEGQVFAKLPRARKVAEMLDQALETMRHQVAHNGPVTPDLISQIEAIRTEVRG